MTHIFWLPGLLIKKTSPINPTLTVIFSVVKLYAHSTRSEPRGINNTFIWSHHQSIEGDPHILLKHVFMEAAISESINTLVNARVVVVLESEGKCVPFAKMFSHMFPCLFDMVPFKFGTIATNAWDVSVQGREDVIGRQAAAKEGDSNNGVAVV
jgi:hypothetical protein